MADKTHYGANTAVGIGINDPSDPETSVEATVYPDWTEFTLQPNRPPIFPETARGTRNLAHSQRFQRLYSSGSIGVPVDPEIAPILWALALGDVTTTELETDEVWEHTIVPVEDVTKFLQGTYRVSEGNIVDEIYNKVATQNINFEFSDGFASLSSELRGDFPEDGSEVSSSYTEKRRYVYHDAKAEFGEDQDAIESNGTELNLRQFSLSLENNLDEDGAFETGHEGRPSRFYPGERNITGQYTIRFENDEEYKRYRDGEKRALRLRLKGQELTSENTADKILKLEKFVFTEQPVQREVNGIVTLQQQFRAEIDNGSDLSVKFINDHDGADYYSNGS